jgi:hypothetical protein
MEHLPELLNHARTQIKYFKQLQEANPNRKLNVEIKKLEVREKLLAELV